MASVTGPDFVALQVSDLAASASFYEEQLGLRRSDMKRPAAVLFETSPIPFAVREPLPGVSLEQASPRPGVGVALWMHTDDATALHEQLVNAGVEILSPLADSPFGRTFTLADPDGYAITVHDRA